MVRMVLHNELSTTLCLQSTVVKCIRWTYINKLVNYDILKVVLFMEQAKN